MKSSSAKLPAPALVLPPAWAGLLIRVVSLAGFVALWQGVSWTGMFSPHQVPSPFAVARTFLSLLLSGDLVYFLGQSMRHYSMGLAWGITLGIGAGLTMAWFRRADQFLSPWVTLLRPIPPLAWIPFAIIWFGITTQAAAFLISLGAFYINLFATYGSVKGVDRRLVEAARTLGEESEWALLRRVVLPAATPGVMTGIRTSLGQGWMTVVAAEMFGIRGVGMQMNEAAGLLAMDVVISYMAMIGLVYFVLDATFRAIERRLLRWR